MKATGIVRRIDDLGRVVIPKEIRRTMKIREGDPLEIFTNTGGEVIFKKYSPIGEMAEFAQQYADALAKETDLGVIICDRERCIAACGIPKREVVDKSITDEYENIINSRTKFISSGKKVRIIEDFGRNVCAAVPIITAGDISGSVALCDNGRKNTVNDSEISLVSVASDFLGRQLE